AVGRSGSNAGGMLSSRLENRVKIVTLPIL
ncbi:MAG: hypothetical protein QOJ65_1246, partial [Fimbriimonadaceae bacterium]|nr:hypothetical protein [Fimbriimonadaceae bacterium]